MLVVSGSCLKTFNFSINAIGAPFDIAIDDKQHIRRKEHPEGDDHNDTQLMISILE